MGIRLALFLDKTLEKSSVEASGFELAPLNGELADAFGLPRGGPNYVEYSSAADALWACMNNWWGRFPNEIYLADPVNGSRARDVPGANWTPFADRGMPGVRIEKRAVGARLIAIEGQPDAVGTAEVKCPPDALTNQTGHKTITKGVSVGHSVTDEVNWSVTFGQSLSVEVEAKPEGIGAGMTRSFSLDIQAGGSKSKTRSTTENVSVSETVNYDVPPGRRRLYTMSVSRGSAIVEIDYDMIMSGAFTVYYKKPLRGNESMIDQDVKGLMDWINQPMVRRVTERREIGLVSDGTIDSTVTNYDGSPLA